MLALHNVETVAGMMGVGLKTVQFETGSQGPAIFVSWSISGRRLTKNSLPDCSRRAAKRPGGGFQIGSPRSFETSAESYDVR